MVYNFFDKKASATRASKFSRSGIKNENKETNLKRKIS